MITTTHESSMISLWRLATTFQIQIQIMMSSRLLPYVLCNDVQSEILLMTYSVNILTGYVVSLAVYTLHDNYYKLNTANSSVIFS